MILSWCIIVKGDEELSKLKTAVDSIVGYVDEVVITANGTKTKETEAWCRSNPKIKYTYLKWNDNFAEQRNFCAQNIRPDAHYYGWMDADDVVVNPSLIRNIAEIGKKQSYDTIFFTYWYGNKFKGKPSLENFEEVELEQMRERLINPRTTRWKKRIHETPVPIDGDNYKYSQIKYSEKDPITWLHLGAPANMTKEEQEAKMARNRRLLELELEDERKNGEADPRTLLYLMKIYAEYPDDGELLGKCVEMGREYLQKSGWDQERAICYSIMSKCLGYLGYHEKARDLLFQALKEYPYDPLIYLYMARAYFNLKNYRAMKHWIDAGLKMDTHDNNTSFQHILELKVLTAELLFKYYYVADRDLDKAYEMISKLNKLNPLPEHAESEQIVYDQRELNTASRNTHKLIQYLEDIGQEDGIPTLIESLPMAIQKLPFAVNYYNRYSKPKRWEKDEICYYANFGQEHVEKWDGNSVIKGIGGSETAVIRLSEEWVKLGYKVTVYGDPLQECEINGVKYLPYYKFNKRDKFNILIQWRYNNLAGKINAKKYIIDLHDVFYPETYTDKIDSIDKLAVKTDYHRSFGVDIPNEKFLVVSNGI